MIWKCMEMLFLSLSKLWCARKVARQMGINVTDLFLLACLCDVLSVPLLNQVYRLPPLAPTSPIIDATISRCLAGLGLTHYLSGLCDFWARRLSGLRRATTAYETVVAPLKTSDTQIRGPWCLGILDPHGTAFKTSPFTLF